MEDSNCHVNNLLEGKIMAQASELEERVILEKLRGLSSERKQEVLDFLEFLELREKSKAWLEFDEWAINLAKEKGFDHLTEEDVARIVSDFRGSR
jgi:hypothetical protein